MARTKITSVQLSDSGVIPGPYTNADITVDSSGRITAASNGSGAGGSPGGSNLEIQYNASGSFGANPMFTFDPSIGDLNFNPGVTGTTSGDVSFRTGDSTGVGNLPGYVILQPGISTDQTDEDGAVEIRVGQIGGIGGYFNVRTNNIERLRIGSQGSWEVNGDSGTVGQVLTSSGSGNPPTWTTSGSSTSAPLNEILFGTGPGVTSDPSLSYDVSSYVFLVNSPSFVDTTTAPDGAVKISSGLNESGYGEATIKLTSTNQDSSFNPMWGSSNVLIEAGSIYATSDGDPFDGGDIEILAGTCYDVDAAAGGNILIQAGNTEGLGGGARAGIVEIKAGFSSADDEIGGSVKLTGGQGFGGGSDGGPIILTGGLPGAGGGQGGEILLEGGAGGLGPINLNGGSATLSLLNNFNTGYLSTISLDAQITKLGQASRPTNATTGFPLIPTTTGTPTGAPAVVTGMVPMVYDTSTNRLWIRNGGVWRSVVLS